ncbi:MAG: hypothetical protein ACJAT2_003631 [Bacteriovoracaceae bacterium]|jgi:hypothetical protein
MLFPMETDYLTWANKYNLRVKVGKCHSCGKEVITNIPFALSGYRGLKSEDHGCGDYYTWKTFKPIGEKEKLKWAKVSSTM